MSFKSILWITILTLNLQLSMVAALSPCQTAILPKYLDLTNSSACGPETRNLVANAGALLLLDGNVPKSVLSSLRDSATGICTRSCILKVQSFIDTLQSQDCRNEPTITLDGLPSAASPSSISNALGMTINSGCVRSKSSSSSFCLTKQVDLADKLIAGNNQILQNSDLICDSCVLTPSTVPILSKYNSDLNTAQMSVCGNVVKSTQTSSSRTSTSTSVSSLPTNIPLSSIPNVDPQCASVLRPILPNLSSACGTQVFDLGMMFIRGNGTASDALGLVSSSLLTGLCNSPCQTQVAALNKALSDPLCSGQLVSPFHQLLAPQVASLFKVFSATACVQEKNAFCFPSQVPRLKTIFSSSKSSDIKSSLMGLVNATDLTCSSCALTQQGNVVHLPVTDLAPGIEEPMVALIAGVQMACENTPRNSSDTLPAPIRAISSAFTIGLHQQVQLILAFMYLFL